MEAETRRRRPALLRVLAAVAAACLLLGGCGGSAGGGDQDGATATPGPGVGEVTTAADGVQEITIQTQDDYVFTPDSFTVAPGDVRLTVRNVARSMVHNFKFTTGEGPEEITAAIPLLRAGEEQTIEFTVGTPGDYTFECSFHTQLGQYGTMTVTG